VQRDWTNKTQQKSERACQQDAVKIVTSWSKDGKYKCSL